MLVAVAAVVVALAAPAAAQAGAFLPPTLHDAAAARPDATFNVIVQGRPWTTALSVAQDVRNEEEDHQGNEHGVRRRFHSINAVAAQLTGRQVLWLARSSSIIAITPDAPLAPSLDLPPVNVTPPAIAGAAEPGSTLTASPGEWTAVGPVYSYQWSRCDPGCADVAGATAATYAVQPGDAGATLTVTVTATDAGGTASAVSAPSAVVAAPPPPPPPPLAPPASLAPPLLSGTATESATLAATDGVWSSGGPLTFTRQWQRCSAAGDACADVPGAGDASYALGALDVGSTLRVVVTATGDAGSASATSDPSAVVAAAPVFPPIAAPELVAPPALGTAPQEGVALTPADGEWTGDEPLTLAYRWQSCTVDECADIVGAEAPAYVPTAEDVGDSLLFVVTATNPAGMAVAASELSAPVAAAPATAPTVVTPPALAAAPQEGVELIAMPGSWSGDGPLTYAYRWQRCTDACVDVPGAEAPSYVPLAADVGATLRVVVTAANGAGSASAVSDPSAVVAALPAAPPPLPVAPAVVTPPPAVAAPQEGVEVTAAHGEWSGDGPLVFGYAWQRCTAGVCVDVPGAVSASYVPVAADVGSTLRVVVTAANAVGSASAASDPSAPVAAAPAPPPVAPAVVSPPVVTGSPHEGVELSATAGDWTGDAPFAKAYAWQRCTTDGCVDVAGANAATYVPVPDDVGAQLRVVVTATNSVGSVSAASERTAAVTAPVAPAVVTVPSVAGTPQEGATAVATAGEWTGDAPLSHTYRWQRCAADACADILGADAAAYVPVAGDIGATLRVVVTTTNALGSAESASDVSAAVLPARPALLNAPVVDGASVAGTRLTVTAGAWTSATPVDYTYRWQRCIGSQCADIDGGTTAAYDAADADVGARLRVTVTAANAGGSTSAASAATERIAPYSPSGFWSWQVGPYAARADASWGTGQPPAIAVVDSGVDGTLPGLEGVVTRQVTLTTLPQETRADGFGHGSFVASIAASRAPGEAGAAPGAHVVSLDVMNDDGMAMTSDVIAAADWIYTHKDEDGIRVANFSLLGSSPSTIQYDPLDKALERLWLSGVVVVTAAGNYAVDGASSDVAFAPANDPFLITVGAADVAGTVPVTDDAAAPWSVYGHTFDGFAKPEIGAPGRYVVAPVPLDSTLYLTRPDRIVSEGKLQLSGTSFAAPLVSGIAAELLAAHPSWTPDQVKGALMVTAVAAGAAAPLSLGVGEVDAAAAAAVADPPNPNEALETFLVDDPAGGPTQVFDVASWGTAVQANASWGTASWGTASWGTASWGTASWGTASWGTSYWSAASWGTASWGTASWGTSSQAVDNADEDIHPDGAYWRWP